MGRVGVFIDRDGTVNEEVGYLDDVDRLRLIPGAARAVRLLNEADVVTILVSNQSGVARGYFPESRVKEVHAELERMLGSEGARLDAIYYCPHHPDFGPPGLRVLCDCRKPRTGMITRGVEEFGLDPLHSYVVGDKLTDIACAKAAGSIGVLVHTGYGRGERDSNPERGRVVPDHEAADLLEAAAWIISREQREGAGERGGDSACKT